MTEEPQDVRRQPQIGAYMNGGGNGAVTYLDTHDLKPKSLFVAGLNGGTAGAFIPAMIGMAGIANGWKLSNSRAGLLAGVAITAVSVAIGATKNVINAKIHNEWAERMTQNAEKQYEVAHMPLTHAERATASFEAAGEAKSR